LGGNCNFADMLGPDANYVYYWELDLAMEMGSISMDYYIRALDTNTDLTETPAIFVQYAFNMTAGMTADITQVSPKQYQAYPGQHANLTVTAYYSDNVSAPAEWSDVSIKRSTLEEWSAMTNVTGKCTVQIQVPAAVGAYTYNLTVTNRSFTAWDEISVTVLSEPLPEIVAEAEDVIISNTQPKEGENITANISVENWGTLEATFFVLVTLDAGGSARVLANVSVTLGPGNHTYIQVAWDAVLGLQYVNVTADPGDFVREASETNNFASVSVTGTSVPGTNDTPMAVYIGIVLIIVIILTIVILLMRRKKPSLPQQ